MAYKAFELRSRETVLLLCEALSACQVSSGEPTARAQIGILGSTPLVFDGIPSGLHPVTIRVGVLQVRQLLPRYIATAVISKMPPRMHWCLPR